MRSNNLIKSVQSLFHIIQHLVSVVLPTPVEEHGLSGLFVVNGALEFVSDRVLYNECGEDDQRANERHKAIVFFQKGAASLDLDWPHRPSWLH
jgi:hypothetical protein